MWQPTPFVRSHYRHVLLILLSSTAMAFASPTVSLAQESTPPVVTQLELQSELMSFADRLATFLGQAARDPAFRAKPELFGDQVLILMSAFTIAAAPNPGVALLDMVVLTTLGRMIYEAHWRQRFGNLVQPTIKAFRLLEADIGRVAATFLTPVEQRGLRALIRTWRQKHPQQVAFAFIRFSNFAEERQEFTLAETETARGLFKSVQEATQSVDDVRLLAERGLYLATRVPLLVGAIGEVWVSRWLQRPELAQLRGDVSQVSDAVERLPENVMKERQAAIDQLMDRVAVERQAAVNHFMDRVSTERQQLMQDLTTEDTGKRGVLTGMQQTLTAGGEFATSVQDAIQALDNYTTHSFERVVAAGKEPTDVTDIRALMADVSQAAQHLQGLTDSLNQLLLSPGWEQRLPQLLQVLDRAKAEGKDFVDFSTDQAFFYGVMLALIFLMGCILVVLVYLYASRRLFGVKT